MTEFFYKTNSNAAPFFSDEGTGYIEATDAAAALALVIGKYGHPAGLFAAAVWASADAFHKNEEPAAKWQSERAYKQAVQR